MAVTFKSVSLLFNPTATPRNYFLFKEKKKKEKFCSSIKIKSHSPVFKQHHAFLCLLRCFLLLLLLPPLIHLFSATFQKSDPFPHTSLFLLTGNITSITFSKMGFCFGTILYEDSFLSSTFFQRLHASF